jgi:hypothetical protein
VKIWLASWQAIKMSPWLGWGLGSFADIYAIVQPESIPLANDLAHSTPIETMVEVGIPIALVGFAIVLIPWGVALYGALTRRRAHRYLPAAAFAVAAVPILHSLVDFSLQMPAIGFVVSAVLGWAGLRRSAAGNGHAMALRHGNSSTILIAGANSMLGAYGSIGYLQSAGAGVCSGRRLARWRGKMCVGGCCRAQSDSGRAGGRGD